MPRCCCLRLALALTLALALLPSLSGPVAAAPGPVRPLPAISHTITPTMPTVGQPFDYTLTLTAPVGEMVRANVRLAFPDAFDVGIEAKLDDLIWNCAAQTRGITRRANSVELLVVEEQKTPSCTVTLPRVATPTAVGAFTITVSGTLNGTAITDTRTLTVAEPPTPAGPVRAGETVTVTTCSSDPATPGSLPAVLAAAGANDTITFAQDCTGANAITLAQPLVPTANVTIDATAATPSRAVTISGGDKGRLFSVNKGVALGLTGLTLTGGSAVCLGSNGDFHTGCPGVPKDYMGGAIVNNGGAVTIRSSTFSDNIARNGGAIYSHEGRLTVSDSTFSGNRAESGGAIYSRGRATISGSTFAGNTGGSLPLSSIGGAIVNTGVMAISDSTFADNVITAKYPGSYDSGGAIFNTGVLTIGGSTFSSNTAGTEGTGGAIANYEGAQVTISGGTFAGNTAKNGGAVGNGGTLTVRGSTFSGNRANTNGGAIATSGTLILALSVVAGNTAPDGPDIFTLLTTSGGVPYGTHTASGGGNVIGVADTIRGFTPLSSDRTGTAAAPLDPLLAPLSANGGPVQTFALRPGSPALDIVSCPDSPAADARGTTRPQGAGCDAGSYEATR